VYLGPGVSQRIVGVERRPVDSVDHDVPSAQTEAVRFTVERGVSEAAAVGAQPQVEYVVAPGILSPVDDDRPLVAGEEGEVLEISRVHDGVEVDLRVLAPVAVYHTLHCCAA
jgi:hypothetical protein